MSPLISCILPTCNRRAFFAQAIQYYVAQDHTRSELIVVDDGDIGVEDICQGLPNLTYIRLSERTPTGRKLNLGIAASRGEIMQKIDDDDYYGPGFLSTAARHLLDAREENPLVAWCCFAVFIAGEMELFFSGHGWHAGGTLCFHRSMWEKQPFREIYASSDGWFIRDHRPTIIRVCAAEQYLLCRHSRNTWKRLKGYESPEQYFRRRRFPKTLNELVGPLHCDFYRGLPPQQVSGNG
jgi:glycosyltransferase involved in cell wall biosynthesis